MQVMYDKWLLCKQLLAVINQMLLKIHCNQNESVDSQVWRLKEWRCVGHEIHIQ